MPLAVLFSPVLHFLCHFSSYSLQIIPVIRIVMLSPGNSSPLRTQYKHFRTITLVYERRILNQYNEQNVMHERLLIRTILVFLVWHGQPSLARLPRLLVRNINNT